MAKTGWIIYNGNLHGEQFLDYAQWFAEAASRKNIQTRILKNNDLLSMLSMCTLSIISEEKGLPDFVIFTDKDIYLAKQLEALGIRLFNRAQAIEISDDKIATYQQLAKHQLPIPKTIIAPKIFNRKDILDLDYLTKISETLGFPLILKEAFGSFGEQVYLIHDMNGLKKQVKKIANRPFVFQEFIETSYGRDLRLQVVGDQVVAAMKRRSKGDFRANITAGGMMEAYQPTPVEQDLAIQATKTIGADFAGVDLLFGPQGRPIVCEINSNAHIRNLYDCTGINSADFIIDYIIHSLK